MAAPDDAEESRQARLLGQLLASERFRRRLSHEELASVAGVAQATVSRLERGEHPPSLRTVQRLAAAMELSPFVTLQPRWAEVDSALDRVSAVTLEDRCEPWEPWLATTVKGHEACGLALTGELGALVQGLPIEARFVELVAGGTLVQAERLLRGCAARVPVVPLHRIAAQDAWVATLWHRWRERVAA